MGAVVCLSTQGAAAVSSMKVYSSENFFWKSKAARTDASGRTGATDIAEGHGGGAGMGKRFVDSSGAVELLCTKAGEGVPAVAGEVLVLKDAKPLPASD